MKFIKAALGIRLVFHIKQNILLLLAVEVVAALETLLAVEVVLEDY
jgi:hypothetical protein